MAPRESFSNLPTFLWRRLETLCEHFENAWNSGKPPRIELYLAKCDTGQRRSLLSELLQIEIECRQRAGEKPSIDEYSTRLPDYADLVGEILSITDTVDMSQARRPSHQMGRRKRIRRVGNRQTADALVPAVCLATTRFSQSSDAGAWAWFTKHARKV